MRAHLTATPVFPAKFVPVISEETRALVLLMMTRDPAKRPASAAEVASAIEQILVSLPHTPPVGSHT
jgi:hypothetical protein